MQTPTHQQEDPLVTGVLERWDTQGLTGEPWPFVAICSLSRLQQVLTRALDVELKRFRLTRTEFFVLTTLALVTGRCSPLGTLSRLLGVHPTTVKLTIDQLEKGGLVGRRPHPRDRRTTLVEITEAGLARTRAANQAIGTAQSGALNSVTPRLRELVIALQPARLAVDDTGYLSDLDINSVPGTVVGAVSSTVTPAE